MGSVSTEQLEDCKKGSTTDELVLTDQKNCSGGLQWMRAAEAYGLFFTMGSDL